VSGIAAKKEESPGSFMSLILKNLLRQRTRTILTVLGISIGITTVVALGVITDSLKATAGEIINLGGADFMVAQEGAADRRDGGRVGETLGRRTR
jgi:putative ABC transport system permease protein